MGGEGPGRRECIRPADQCANPVVRLDEIAVAGKEERFHPTINIAESAQNAIAPPSGKLPSGSLEIA